MEYHTARSKQVSFVSAPGSPVIRCIDRGLVRDYGGLLELQGIDLSSRRCRSYYGIISEPLPLEEQSVSSICNITTRL